MKDRIPTHAGRVRLVPVSGQTNVYDMTMADEPTEQGTPLNKANLLSDITASLLSLTGNPTVNDALAIIANNMCRVVSGNYVGTATYGESNPNTLVFEKTPVLLIIYGGTTASNGAYAFLIPSAGVYSVKGIVSSANVVSASNGIVSWYAASAANQLNVNLTYYYAAVLEEN